MKLTGKSQAQVDAEAAQKKLDEKEQALLEYLAITDWYVVRFAETAQPVPEEVIGRREQARQRISELRAKE
jgi:hypothetical protein